MKKARIGQSTIEYVIVFAMVAGAIIMVGAMLKPKVQGAYSDLATAMQSKVKQEMP
ncbi:MAG: hypothetical protein NTX01_08790 [Candidatus Omnitrophica bacterium]|nr:hypothetical protein [Candidatus Omnitrophota bacterium]